MRRSPGRRPAPVAGLLLAGLLALPVPAARAETLEDRLDAHLAALERARGGEAHWHLAEAQRLAPDVAGGLDRLRPVAADLADRSPIPWMQGEALGTLAAFDHRASPEEARMHLRDAGVLLDGLVLGPLPGPGVEASSEPATAFDPEGAYGGKRAEIGWRPFAGAALTGPLHLPDLLEADGDAHAFLAWGLEASRPTRAMIDLGTNGPVTAWLDGRRIVSWDGERPLTDWQHAVPVRLDAGLHRLVVRVGHRGEAPQVLPRVLDRRGRLPDPLRLVSPGFEEEATGWTSSERLPQPLPDLHDGDPALAGRLALLASDTSPDRREAARILEEAVEAAPDDPDLRWLLGRAERSDRDRARRAFEAAVERSDGRHPEALAALLRLHREQGLEAKADALARDLAEADPDHPALLVDRLQRLARLSDAAAALGMEAVGGPLADHPGVAHLRGRLAQEAGRPLDAIESLTTAAVAWGAPPGLVDRIVGLSLRAGRPDDALLHLEAALARRPYAVPLHLAKARALAAGDAGPTEASRALADALELHPHSASLHEMRGRMLLLAGDRAAALEAVGRAAALRPQDRTLADYHRRLQQRTGVAERHAVDPEEVIAGAADEPPAPEGARTLLDLHAIRVHDSGLSSHFRQQVIRLDDPSAVDRLEEIPFPYTPGEERLEVVEAEVLHPDGSRSRAAGVRDRRPGDRQGGVYTLAGARVVQFDRLEAGDVVHVRIRRDEVGSRNLFGAFFGVLMPVQEALPKRRLVVRVDAPTSRRLHAHGARLPEPTRRRDGNRQVVEWDVRDLPGLEMEPRMPGWGDVAAYVNVSTYGSWDELAGWYANLVRPQLTLSPGLQRKAEALVADADSVRDEVAAVHAWVVRNTRYVGIEFGIHGFKPYRVTRVVRRGYGDCKDKTSLLVAMLDAVGVEARFVLVRTRNMGHVAPEPATLWAFNHAIAFVPALDAWLDPTSEFAGLGELPALDQGAMALRLDVLGGDPRPELTTIPFLPAELNAATTEVDLTIAPTGDAEADVAMTVEGTSTPEWRRAFQEESRRRDRLAGLLSRAHAGTVLREARFEGLDALGRPLRVEALADLPGFARRVDDRLEVPVALDPNDLLRDLGRDASRHQPLVLDHPWRETSTVRLRLPDGARLRSAPDPVDVETPFGAFSMEVEATPGGAVIRSTLEVAVARVEPTRYPDFRRFLGDVTAARGRRLSFSLDDPSGSGQLLPGPDPARARGEVPTAGSPR
ncbi:MAG: DUF3857 domain-containing protein [Myxococcota bacterium]